MGLFSKKQKVTVDDMAMKAMLAASEAIGKLTTFDEVSDTQNMIVGMGYFYGFLKMNLNSITSQDVVNTIIEKSITNLMNATKNNPEFVKAYALDEMKCEEIEEQCEGFGEDIIF